MAFDVPIAFCIYNRPDEARRVLLSIREQKPRKLYVIADGPKADDERDQQQVQETLKTLELIDWSCDVALGDSLVNLGCRERIASGLNWAFSQSERLIILEDDCLPSPSFFNYCRDLLDRYADQDRVMMISGDRFVPEQQGSNEVYFSRWTHIWGWASWRRAWEKFDVEMANWGEHSARERLQQVSTAEEYATWESVFEKVYRQELDTWDFSWQFACWLHDGLVAIPPRNLVSNIGFGNQATHTRDANSQWANLPACDLSGISLPTEIARNLSFDHWTLKHVFAPAFPREKPASPTSRRRWWQRWGKTQPSNR